MRKSTPHEWYEVYRDKVYQDYQAGRLPDDWKLPALTWEELSAWEQQQFREMALKANSIVAEFTVEEHKKGKKNDGCTRCTRKYYP